MHSRETYDAVQGFWFKNSKRLNERVLQALESAQNDFSFRRMMSVGVFDWSELKALYFPLSSV